MQQGLTGLHCVRWNSSNSTNSSIDCARIERLQDTHFDSRKNISFCTTGFRRKSDSSNPILQSFDKPLNNEAKARWLGVRDLHRLTGTDATGLPNHSEQTSILCPRFCSDWVIARWLLYESGYRASAFSTLSTPSTAPVLHCPENFLQLALLRFVSVLVCDLPLEKSAIA
jgi:hypothetical protein